VGPRLCRERQSIARVVDRRHVGAAGRQRHREELQDVGVVVDDENAESHEHTLEPTGVLRRRRPASVGVRASPGSVPLPERMR